MNTSRAFGVTAALEDLGIKSAEVLGRVRSESTKGRRYTVRQDDGNYTCTCPDFQYRHAGKGTQCKHIRARLERRASDSKTAALRDLSVDGLTIPMARSVGEDLTAKKRTVPARGSRPVLERALEALRVKSPPTKVIQGRSAADNLRSSIQSRYGHRAPQYAADMLGTVNAMEAMDPEVMAALESIDIGLSAGPRKSRYVPGRVDASSPVFSKRQAASYSPDLRSITLDDASVSTGLHEMGHAVDDARYGLPASVLQREASATRRAFDAMGGVDPELAAHNGTYFERNRAKNKPDRVVPEVRDAISQRGARLREMNSKIRQLDERFQAARAAGIPTHQVPGYSLYQNLRGAAVLRGHRLQQDHAILTSPIAAPHLRAAGARRPAVAEGTVRKLDEYLGEGAGAAAKQYHDATYLRNLENELPAVAGARARRGISATASRAADLIRKLRGR